MSLKRLRNGESRERGALERDSIREINMKNSEISGIKNRGICYLRINLCYLLE